MTAVKYTCATPLPLATIRHERQLVAMLAQLVTFEHNAIVRSQVVKEAEFLLRHLPYEHMHDGIFHWSSFMDSLLRKHTGTAAIKEELVFVPASVALMLAIDATLLWQQASVSDRPYTRWLPDLDWLKTRVIQLDEIIELRQLAAKKTGFWIF